MQTKSFLGLKCNFKFRTRKDMIYQEIISFNESMKKFLSDFFAFTRYGIVVFLLLQSTFSTAKQVTKEEALIIAQKFYQEQCQSKNIKRKTISPTNFKLEFICTDSGVTTKSASLSSTTSDSVAYYYVYNIDSNQGFVIVSGDDRATPILGYSDEGKFIHENMPEHIKAFMNNYKEQIKAIIKRNDATIKRKTLLISNGDTAVAPLITTKWGQQSPYNSQIRSNSGLFNAPTGCVATSMAQVMNYNKWPEKGTSSLSYTYNGNTFSANFGNTTYDWTNMLEAYSANDNAASASSKAVATLMFHCGVSLKMQYASTASGAYTSDIVSSLVNYFGYDKNIKYTTSDNYTPSQFKYQIISEINARRPVIIAGYDTQSAHSYIADGYDAYDFIHFNWGWDGDYNGYYEVDPIDASTYWKPKGIITGIKKSESTSALSLCYQGFNLTYNVSLPRTQPLTPTINVSDENGNSFNGTIGLAFYRNEILHAIINTTGATIGSGSSFSNNFSISIPDTLSNGTYRLVPIFKATDETVWSEIKFKNTILATDTRVNENIEFVVSALDFVIYQNSKTMNCGEGDFRSNFSYSDWENVQRLVITGKINQWDLLYMASAKSIKTIDIKNASILDTKIDNSALAYGGNPGNFYDFYRNLSSKWKDYEKNFWHGFFYKEGDPNWKNMGNGIFYNNYWDMYYNTNNGEYFNEFNPNCDTQINVQILGSLEDWTHDEMGNPLGLTIIRGKGIMADAFTNSTVESITLPNNLAYIAPMAFANCPNLNSINLPDSVGIIGDSILYNCKNITTIKFPKYLSAIHSQMFKTLSNLNTVTLPSSLKTLNDSSFYNCAKITSISLPDSLSSIGKCAFSNCSGLVSIDVSRPVPIDLSSSPNVFSGVDKTSCALNIPAGTKSAYLTANQWKDFLNIKEVSGLSLSSSFFKLAFSAGSSASVNVYSDLTWTVSSDQGWLTISQTSGTGNGKLTFTAEANNTGKERIAKITLSSPGINSKIITIIQQEKIALSLSATIVDLSSSAGSTASINTYSDLTWSASSNQPWLTVSPTSGNGNVLITLKAEVNISAYERKALITFSATGISNKTIAVTQAGNVIIVTAGNLSSLLTTTQKDTLTKLVLSGSIDARDFKTMSVIPNLKYLDIKNVIVNAYTGNAGTFGSANMTYPKNTIPLYTFYRNSKLSTVILPATVTSIDEAAFEECSLLKSITIPPSVASIGIYVFYKCVNLTSITLPSSVTSIGKSAFGNCTSLSTINFPSSHFSIDRFGFYNCKNLTIPIIPPTLTSIGVGTFAGCKGPFIVDANNPNYTSENGILFNKDKTSLLQASSNINSYTIPSFVDTIGPHAFALCGNLNSITINSSIKSIGYYAFKNCSNLHSIIIPSSVMLIDEGTFYDCQGLTSVAIPSSVTSIGGESFSGCTSLTSITIPSSVTSIGYSCFMGCTRLTSIVLPPSLTSISSGCFEGCTGLTKIDIPWSINTLGWRCFWGCTELTSVTIPASVYSIESSAFYNCRNLTTIIEKRSTPVDLSSQAYIFDGVDKNKCILFVPLGTTSSYKVADQWKDFINIKESADLYLNIAASEGSTASVNLTSSNTWSVSSDQSWLKTNPTHGTGNATITFTAEANNTTTERTAIVTILYTTLFNKILVTQAAGNTMLSVSANTVSIAKEAGSVATIDVTSNTAWSASSNQTWLTASPASGTGSATLTFTAEINPTAASRTAIVTVSATGVANQTITVTQAAGSGTGVSEEASESISVFPNPVTDGFLISGIENIVKLELLDMNGRLLLSKEITANEYVSAETLPQGLYVIKLITSRGTILQKMTKK